MNKINNKSDKLSAHEADILNKKLKEDFEIHGSVDTLTKYIMSELVSPIEDYLNAISLIRANYQGQLSCELLIIGAYLINQWTTEKNEMLMMLNEMYRYLPERERAIVSYLNAHQIYMTDESYKTRDDYRVELLKSISFGIPFVNNYVRMAEISDLDVAKSYYSSALNYIERIFSEQDSIDIKEYALNADRFIKEYILGLVLSKENYEDISKKCV